MNEWMKQKNEIIAANEWINEIHAANEWINDTKNEITAENEWIFISFHLR